MSQDEISVSWISVPKENLVKSDDRYEIYERTDGHLTYSITVLKAGQATRGHKHGHWENYHFEDAGLKLFLNGFEIAMDAGRSMIIPPNMHHAVRNDTDKDIPFLCIWHDADVQEKEYTDIEQGRKIKISLNGGQPEEYLVHNDEHGELYFKLGDEQVPLIELNYNPNMVLVTN